MQTKFSEFQFAYSITREIEDKIIYSSYSLGIPIMPTQNKEANLGYDVKFKGSFCAVFLQYKLPAKLTRSSANEWGEFNSPYFRIKVYADNESHQHNLLCNLAKCKRNRVFYCAPAFTEEKEFMDFHINRVVSRNSAFINAKGLKTISGDDNHVIVYQINPNKSIMCSEPQYTEICSGWEQLLNFSLDYKYESLEEFVTTYSDQTKNSLIDNDVLYVLRRIGEQLLNNGIQLFLLKQ